MVTYKSADDFFQYNTLWTQELFTLREILLESGLEETSKWGIPVYTYKSKNVVGLAAFKAYFGIWYFQGALLQDSSQLLISANEGNTKAQRQLRMNSKNQINRKIILAYIKESIAHIDAGIEIKSEKNKPLLIPKELSDVFKKNKSLKTQFNKLNLTKQREYAEYIEQAKQEKTKLTRLEKIIPMIIEGTGLNDKYRK
jgi:uncharacterized protein YdeI (YjbR/CyaY-like superfamily)